MTEEQAIEAVATEAGIKLVVRHATTPEQMRAMVRDLALWMYDHGVEHISLARTPGTAKLIVTVDGSTND